MKEYKKISFDETKINALAALGFEVVPGIVGPSSGSLLMVREKPQGQTVGEHFKDYNAIVSASAV